MTTERQPSVRDRRWVTDLVLGIAVAIVTVLADLATGSNPSSVLVGILLCAALPFRRCLPSLALAIGLAGAVAHLIVLTQPTLSLIVIPILVYSIARWGERRLGRIAGGAALVGSLLGPMRWALAYGGFGANIISGLAISIACAGTVSAFYLIGRRRRESAENAAQRRQAEAERAQLMQAEQEQRARSVTVEERTRIARELHDIVAHSLSVIVVQAEGGRALAAKHPERAPAVLATIADTSREALEEMRQMVGLLRSGGAEPEQVAYGPTPGLADLAELVRKTSETAEFSAFGTVPRVSPALGLTAYRVVQESLTNVLKHAGAGAAARVTVAYTAESIEIEVSDNGRGSAALTDRLGHGLQGMRERVALHGGAMSAQPRPGGGFVVRVWLPYAHEPSLPRPLDELRPTR